MTAATIDPAEIAKFSALAASWWDPAGPFRALHLMNPVRLGYIVDKARAQFAPPPAGELSPQATEGARQARTKRFPLKGLTALDLGCGGGLTSAPLARLGATVTAVDASPEAIGAARAYADQAGLDIDFQVASAEELAARGVRFDLVVALEIVEHVADVAAFLGAAQTLVAPGGLCILSTINRTPKARALALFGAEKLLHWAPEGAHDYDKLVTPEEIRAAAPQLSWDAPAGISFNPLGQGWELSRDTAVNYLMAGRRA